MKYYFDSYSFGNRSDVKKVLHLNWDYFKKSFFCGLCCVKDKHKTISSSSAHVFEKRITQDAVFEIVDFDGRLFYVWPDHISNENFVRNKNIFDKIINYISKKPSLSISWRRPSICENFGEHLYFEGRLLEEGEAVIRVEKITDGNFEILFNIVNSFFKDYRTSNDKYVLFEGGYLKIVQIENCKALAVSENLTYEFEQKTMDGKCHRDYMLQLIKGYAKSKCMYNCEVRDKQFLNYLISRHITCEYSHANYLGDSEDENVVFIDMNKFYSKLLKDELFYELAVTSQVLNTYQAGLSSSESRVLDGELVAEIIKRNMRNLVSSDKKFLSSKFVTTYNLEDDDEETRKIFRIPHETKKGPKVLSNSSTYGTVIDSEFGKLPVVIKIDKSLKNGLRPDLNAFVEEYITGVKMNSLADRGIVPLTLACFICPSALEIKEAKRHKRNAELCAYTEGSIPTSFLVIEKLEGMNLSSYLRKNKVTEKILISILLQITRSLIIAKEELNFTHHDIHFGNIMVKPRAVKETTDKIKDDKSGNFNKFTYDTYVDVKIIDFGMANFTEKFQGIDVFIIMMTLLYRFITGSLNYKQYPVIVNILNDYIITTRIFNYPGVSSMYNAVNNTLIKDVNPETIGRFLRKDKEHFTTYTDYVDEKNLLFQNLKQFYWALAKIYDSASEVYTEKIDENIGWFNWF